MSTTSTEPRPSRIEVSYEPMTKDGNAAWQRRTEAVLGLKLGGRWRGTFYPQQDRCVFQPRPELPDLVRHPGTNLFREAKTADRVLYYARDEQGQDLGWNLDSSALPHTLIIGPTGGGKTTVLRSLIASAVCQGISVYGCDPKRVELRPFEGFPGIGGIASSTGKMAGLIEDMKALMDRRYAQIERDPQIKDQLQPVLFILDELLILRKALTRLWKNEPDDNGKKRTGTPIWLEYIQELLALARTSRIHVVIGVQRPDASLFEEGARDNLGHRVSLMRLSPEGSKMLWGNATTGIDLPVKRGRAMASPTGGAPVEVQTYWLSEPGVASGEDKAILEALRDYAEPQFTGFDWPIDPEDYRLFDPRLNPANQDTDTDKTPVDEDRPGESAPITSQDDVPMSTVGELETSTVNGIDVDTEDVRAESVTVGDRVLMSDGGIGTVTEVDEDPTDDDLVAITVEVDGEPEMLSLSSSDYLDRVLDYGEDDE